VSRLGRTFGALRAEHGRALIPYFTAGDPSLADTRHLCLEAARRGADIIEIGVPFSDPLADGPIIQRAARRALATGVSLPRVLELIRDLRTEVAIPLVALTYYNPVLAFGVKAFARSAADAGLDGVIVADLPPEEAEPLAGETEAAGIDLVHLVAPTSTPARMRLIARRSRGFLYVVALTGVTGVRETLATELVTQLRALRLVTTRPICVGFGISTPDHVGAVAPYADGVIVGSAVVRLVEQHAGTPDLIARVGAFVDAMKAPLRPPPPAGRAGLA
jgi:tryptophan synthase alpha chain